MFISEFSVWVTSAYDRYILAKNVSNNSENDLPTDPYRSKYKAKNILSQLVSEIDMKWKSYEANMQVKLLYSLFNYEIGLVALETEETSVGCDALYLSWEHIRDIANSPEGCHLALKILNQIAIIWSERGENAKALEELLTAEKLYYEYKLSHEVCPYDSEDMFMLDSAAEREWAKFEKTFTHTLYYLAQVYELADDSEKAAGYCRETLERQRESGYYELADWASNCATLSQYYVAKKNFREACHLLCSAADAAHKRETELNEKEVDEEKDVWGEYHRVIASISCCWIKYCIALIQESHNASVSGNEKIEDDQALVRVTTDKSVLAMEETILTSVSCFEDAKSLFLFAVNHVKEAKLHYTLNQYANNYVQIIRDHSNLYKCLAYYESDLSRLCKMLKRRIDMLEEVLKKLNPQYYLSVCRQLQFELGEIYFEMVHTKLKIKESSIDSFSSSAVKKVNSLINQGISHFEDFVKSLQDKSGKYPDTFSEENVRTVLLAYFYMGRLHTKLIERDSNCKLHNLTKSEECFEFIVNYIEKNPNHTSCIEEEYKLSKEILELMPGRKAQITGPTLF